MNSRIQSQRNISRYVCAINRGPVLPLITAEFSAQVAELVKFAVDATGLECYMNSKDTWEYKFTGSPELGTFYVRFVFLERCKTKID